MAQESVLTLDHRLSSAGDLARGLITASVVAAAGQDVSFVLPVDRARRVGREIEALLRLETALLERDAMQQAAGAEIRRLHDAAQRSFRKALVSLGISLAFCVAGGVMLIVGLA